MFTFGRAAEGPLSSLSEPTNASPRRGDHTCRRPPRSTYLFLDVDGNVLVSWTQAEGQPDSPSAAAAYQTADDAGTVVYGLRRATSAVGRRPACNGDGRRRRRGYHGRPGPVGSAIVCCAAPSSENPHGGANKNLAGLYSRGFRREVARAARPRSSLSFGCRQRRPAVGYVTARTAKERLMPPAGLRRRLSGAADGVRCGLRLSALGHARTPRATSSSTPLLADATPRHPRGLLRPVPARRVVGHSQRRDHPSPMPSSASRTARSSAPSMRRRS